MWRDKMIGMPTAEQALPGRDEPMTVPSLHYVNQQPMKPPYPGGMEEAMFGMGCFWGVERLFWQQEGVFVTAAGYAAGYTPHPTYKEVCSGLTGHNEVVHLVFDPQQITYQQMLILFWQSHDPTQGMRQGNDIGTQYRSGIYSYSPEQFSQAQASMAHYQARLATQGFSGITTEIIEAPEFYFAEDYHQQYLAKNPDGYCALGGLGVSY